MMRKKRIYISFIIVVCIIVISAILGAILQPSGSNDLIVAVVSLAVAILALYISMKTFISIDEVNAISRMDGNVMENSRYRPNILRAIFKFRQIDFSDASEALMSHMESLFKKSSNLSGAHIADNVQEVADLMVLVPFFIQTNNEKASSIHLERVSKLISTMKNHVDNFKEISDGSCKLLEETVNLIDSVFSYQKMTISGMSDPSKLLEIRGSIFINPVSCVLYNNYLGLYFLRRANLILSNQSNIISLKSQLENIKKCTNEDKSLALIYLNKASELFKCAKDNIGSDMIWKAFVSFNIARAEYLRLIVELEFGNEVKTEWEAYINDSIRSWVTINQIIEEHFGTKFDSYRISWLQQALISQENKVKLFKIIYQINDNVPLTDQNGNKWTDRYGDILETSFFIGLQKEDVQNRTDCLVDDIYKFLGNGF